MTKAEIQSKLVTFSAALEGQAGAAWDRIGTDPQLASLVATVELVARDLAAMAEALDLDELLERRYARLVSQPEALPA